MVLYHIGRNGRPGECTASSPSNCPLRNYYGTETPHFNTYQDASQWYDSHQEEQWSPIYSSPIVYANTLDEEEYDGERIDYNGDILQQGEQTYTEGLAIGELMETERQIEAHQKDVASGKSSSNLLEKINVDGLSSIYVNLREYRLAFLNGDYDKARRIHAQAVRDTYDYDGTLYMTTDELIRCAQEEYNEY